MNRAFGLAALVLAPFPALAGKAAPTSLPVASVRYDAEIEAARGAVKSVFAVPGELVKAVIHVESRWNPNAVSHAGAIGLMQLMPETARKVGVDPRDLRRPARNILAGVRYLAVLLRYYDGDLISALSAYNAGPRGRLAEVPRNGETPEYVLRVLEAQRQYAAAEGDL